MDENNNNIKIIGLIHLIGNILSGGIAGTLGVMIFLILNNNLNNEEKRTCYDILNFNISFFIYFFVSGLLMFVLIGFVLFSIVLLIWLILLIIGGIKHLSGDTYIYPLSIKIFKIK